MKKLYINVIAFCLTGCTLLTACDYKKSGDLEGQRNHEISTSQNNNPLENVHPIDTDVEEKKNTNEEEIINYFESMKEEVSNCLSSENVNNFKENVKNIIIDAIDFIFYGKEIKGFTFEELSEETKEKIMKLVAEMDMMIESKKPGYKEELKSSFGRFKDAAKNNISNIDEVLKNTLGESYNHLKELFGATGELGIDIAETGLGLLDSGFTYIKEWYEEETGKR